MWYKDLTLQEMIRVGRARKGLTQRQLADQLEVSSVTVSLWETGKHSPGLISTGSLLYVMEIPSKDWAGFMSHRGRHEAA